MVKTFIEIRNRKYKQKWKELVLWVRWSTKGSVESNISRYTILKIIKRFRKEKKERLLKHKAK